MRESGTSTNSLMRPGVLCLVFTLCAICPVFIGTGNASAESHTPSLVDVVLFGINSATDLKESNAPAAGDSCVRKYLATLPQDSVLWRQNPPLNAEEAVSARRRNLVEQMAAILGEKVRSEAQSFASSVPLMAEWEGMSEGPVGEADFAGQWLAKRPDSAIAPFLHLFMAHRLRAGYEAARAGREKGLLPVLARRYHTASGKAKTSGNELISCIADEMKAQAFVYLKGHGQP